MVLLPVVSTVCRDSLEKQLELSAELRESNGYVPRCGAIHRRQTARNSSKKGSVELSFVEVLSFSLNSRTHLDLMPNFNYLLSFKFSFAF